VDTVLTISEIILFLSVSILCVYLIGAIGKIGTSISNLEKSIKELKNKLEPILDNFNLLIEKTKIISDSINKQLDVTHSVVKSIRLVADDIIEFEREIKSRIEKPVLEFVNIVFGFISGLRSILGFLKKTDE